MHGYSRLGNGRSCGVNSPSPPSSPRLRHGRNKSFCFSSDGGGGGGGGSGRLRAGGVADMKLQNFVERVVYLVISTVYRRRGVLLLAPFLYISGMLLYMGTFGFDVVNKSAADGVGPPGSVYRSHQVFQRLRPYMEAQSNQSSGKLLDVWNLKLCQRWKPCVKESTLREGYAELPKSNGFLIIEANGGLNQQRLSICDAVALAGLLNATLVIPIFHVNSVWRDSSKFGDIFDEEFFIHALRNHVNVVRELPDEILQRVDNNISNIVNLRVKAWSSPTYYLHKVLPKLMELGAVRIAPFSNRLARDVPSYIQGLRCLANFAALRFAEPIRMLSEKMVGRMVMNSSGTGGKYVSVHLRFEEDMVAFSCCIYDGGEEEKHELDIARERSWRGKFRKHGRVIRPGGIRMDGKCPLTPLEVGMMLRGMGFDNNTSVYIAAGKIYRAEKYMDPIKQLFPRLEMKDTLATPEELTPFEGHLSRLAALDYTICLYSEVFVTTQGGNFPHFLIGHRRYVNEGHAKTIKPDKRKLALIFDKPSIRWETFKSQLKDMLHRSDVKGCEWRKQSGSVYNYPMPDCMCKQADARHGNGNTSKFS